MGARKSYFDIGTSSSGNTTKNEFVASRTISLSVRIDKCIAYVIIGDMKFHPRDMDGVNQARRLSSFKSSLDLSEVRADSNNLSR